VVGSSTTALIRFPPWRRASEIRDNGQGKTSLSKIESNLPPFVEADIAIVIVVNVLEEFGESACRHSKTSTLESELKLFFIETTIVISVDGFEQEVELSLGCLDKDSEFCCDKKCMLAYAHGLGRVNRTCPDVPPTFVLHLAIAVGINHLNDDLEEIVRILESCVGAYQYMRHESNLKARY
jgi:hypothetical protein